MVINLYAGFHKKRNSTLRPDEHIEVQTVSGYMKEPFSILRPIFNLQNFPPNGRPYFYQYAYVPTFGRYYFVEDWSFEGGLWNVSLSVDVLATYRTAIGENNLYVTNEMKVQSSLKCMTTEQLPYSLESKAEI